MLDYTEMFQVKTGEKTNREFSSTHPRSFSSIAKDEGITAKAGAHIF